MVDQADKISLLVIAGPTGVGKTDLSIDLAHRYQGEIINGDSLQVYEGLDIGTGKILPHEMQGVPHHLLDILEVWQDYDASAFKVAADQAIQDIASRGKLPILVGGSGLYLQGLLYDLDFGGQASHDPAIRAQLEGKAQEIGPLALWQELDQVDPQAAAKIPYQNVRRTIRALEVIESTGHLFSDQTSANNQVSTYQETLLVLDRPRAELYQRINNRVEAMLEAGLEEEARSLYEMPGSDHFQSMQGIGYKEWRPYFQGQASLEETVAEIQQNSRRYAKRQLTWFRNRMKAPNWINLGDPDQARQQLEIIMARQMTD